MTSIVLDAKQIQSAPAPVRLWLEQQISAALVPGSAAGTQLPRLVACTETQAANLLSRIRQVPSAVEVFFGLAHPEISYGSPPVVTFRLLDLQRRAGLESITKLLECLDHINRAWCRPGCGWNAEWRNLRHREAIRLRGEVNWLIDGFCGERFPAIDLAHVDLTGSEQSPEQHGRGVR